MAEELNNVTVAFLVATEGAASAAGAARTARRRVASACSSSICVSRREVPGASPADVDGAAEGSCDRSDDEHASVLHMICLTFQYLFSRKPCSSCIRLVAY